MILKKAILATLAYHDIFDYPLKKEEIHQFLIGKVAYQTSIGKELKLLSEAKIIGTRNALYFLRNRSKIVAIRKQREKYSKSKTKRARFFAAILKIIPSIKFVAISGALAMQNSHKNDDIDLVIVASQGTLWTTRFLSNILLFSFKRDVRDQKITDRACLNVFIDQSQLKISPANLYLAHEICQMKPLWGRDSTYARFLKANAWIEKFLPNWQPSSQFTVHSSQKRKPSTVNCQLSTVETFLKKFQLWYMRPKITTERIGKHQLFFHPQDTQNWVMGEYQKRLKRLDIPF